MSDSKGGLGGETDYKEVIHTCGMEETSDLSLPAALVGHVWKLIILTN